MARAHRCTNKTCALVQHVRAVSYRLLSLQACAKKQAQCHQAPLKKSFAVHRTLPTGYIRSPLGFVPLGRGYERQSVQRQPFCLHFREVIRTLNDGVRSIALAPDGTLSPAADPEGSMKSIITIITPVATGVRTVHSPIGIPSTLAVHFMDALACMQL